ncbi:hypothetical protein FSARC_14776 [Fusarium sarcochroum]|uniref:Uncharacterized protein n=1 Tax=Fusarium sarcochroum TaxID=1208366 RepID=A0A8H4SR58_9HYPO|nr:hypothetical protein FSARC_14776 [Fusarium sarcochroum]
MPPEGPPAPVVVHPTIERPSEWTLTKGSRYFTSPLGTSRQRDLSNAKRGYEEHLGNFPISLQKYEKGMLRRLETTFAGGPPNPDDVMSTVMDISEIAEK